MKLELKHIAPYLPYGLKVKGIFKESFTLVHDRQPNNLNVLSLESLMFFPNEHKPILRPLSDFANEFYAQGLKTRMDKILVRNGLAPSGIEYDINDNVFYIGKTEDSKSYEIYDVFELPFKVVDVLFEYHFDVFGLIPQGLAIDINTLES